MLQEPVVGSSPRIKRGWMNLRVLEVMRDTPDTVTIKMVNAEDGIVAFDYKAGQYLTFRFDDLDVKPIVRSYTLSSSPCQTDHIAFTVKAVEDGHVSHYLTEKIQAGDVLRARGPIGRFCFDHKIFSSHLVMIAAGSGVTPFLSIMREYKDRLGQPGAPTHMSLLVSYRSVQDIIGRELIQELKAIPGIQIGVSLSREDRRSEGYLHGRIDSDMIINFVGALGSKTYMSCGPQLLMNTAMETLKAQGVDSQHIHVESFDT
jgi:ferredoxin-NADP reductase